MQPAVRMGAQVGEPGPLGKIGMAWATKSGIEDVLARSIGDRDLAEVAGLGGAIKQDGLPDFGADILKARGAKVGRRRFLRTGHRSRCCARSHAPS